MNEWLLLAASLLLVGACGVFVAAEFAFVTVDRSVVDRAADAGDRRATGVRLALGALSTQLSGAQLGITITNLAIGFLAEPAISALIEDPLESAGISDGAVTPISVAIGLTVATVFTMVFGELVPKSLAIANPLGTARATQRYQRVFTLAMAVPIRFLNGSANIVVRALGVEPQEELRSARSSPELASLIRRSGQQGTLDPGTARLMERSVTFSTRTAGEIMTPRVRMNTIKANQPVNDVVDLAKATGHSRFPVLDGASLDVVGVVHIKHTVAVPVADRGTTKVADILVDATIVPDVIRLDPLLDLLREEGFQLAVVVDEYGGTAGVVTLEDVVEEIIGDISDEHDTLGAGARHHHDGSWSVSGLLRPDEVQEVTGFALPEHSDYDTVAGLILKELGRLPQRGDSVEIVLKPTLGDGGGNGPGNGARTVVLRVEHMQGRRVDRVQIDVLRSAADPRRGGEPHE